MFTVSKLHNFTIMKFEVTVNTRIALFLRRGNIR